MRNQHARDIRFLDVMVVPEPSAAPRKTMLEYEKLAMVFPAFDVAIIASADQCTEKEQVNEAG